MGTKAATARDVVKVAFKSAGAHAADKKAKRRDAKDTDAKDAEGSKAAAADAKAGENVAEARLVAERKQNEMMMSFLEVMWRITVVDVEATLRSAAHKVLRVRPRPPLENSVRLISAASEARMPSSSSRTRENPRVRRYDHSVDKAARLRRAAALVAVGRAFKRAAADSGHAETWQESLRKNFAGGGGGGGGDDRGEEFEAD